MYTGLQKMFTRSFEIQIRARGKHRSRECTQGAARCGARAGARGARLFKRLAFDNLQSFAISLILWLSRQRDCYRTTSNVSECAC